ncbi:hypothetical protein LZ318_20565 [Saccharopolyspora indica]|uniref:hypothetical protein n=1 Tax=Saccharopolyspora indica TaxID=1229659 RepID=UPI0022EA7197|nr:hypothetical protein [Saccharopolyspora indica]MDA3643220.1 hypothetical protein [Saccharopolyspora indica]
MRAIPPSSGEGRSRTAARVESGDGRSPRDGLHFADIAQKGKFSISFDPAGHVTTSPSAVGASLGEGGVDVEHDFGIK